MLRLLTLLAVLLMPFGIAPAAAHAPAASGMPMQHCPEQGAKGNFGECTMACSAALPAETRQDNLPVTILCALGEPAVTQSLTGIHPETAKPPPRLG